MRIDDAHKYNFETFVGETKGETRAFRKGLRALGLRGLKLTAHWAKDCVVMRGLIKGRVYSIETITNGPITR